MQLGQLAINTAGKQSIISNVKKQIKVHYSHLRKYVMESHRCMFKLSISGVDIMKNKLHYRLHIQTVAKY